MAAPVPGAGPGRVVTATVAARAAVAPRRTFVTGDVDGAVAHATLVAGPWLARAFDDLVAGDGRGDAAACGSLLAMRASGAIVELLVGGHVAQRRLCSLAGAGYLTRDTGVVHGIVVRDPQVVVAPDDPEVDDAEVVVRGVGDQPRLVAERLVDALDPVFAAIDAITPYGRRGMWGAVVDAVHGTAARTARTEDVPVVRARADAVAVADALADRVPTPRTRPEPVAVEDGGVLGHYARKATCCLWYRRAEPAARDDTSAYCGTCPHLAEDRWRPRLAAAWHAERTTRATTSPAGRT